MLWSQEYAAANRARMMDAALTAFFAFIGTGAERPASDCHHNFAQRETHGGRAVWVTRKGAIRAGVDDLGLIPGSMGTRSYVIRGKGNPLSYESCAHGAGRRMSRTQARKQFGAADLTQAMQGRTWLSASADKPSTRSPRPTRTSTR